ncbi:MAG: hypothetical protein Q8N94_07565 [Methanoregula sp.]|nr:hypothetical protein [Methanoregula sp.]
MTTLNSLCNLPNPDRPYHTDPQLRRARKIRPAPGFSGDEWSLAGNFPSGLCMKNFNRTFAEKL